MPLVCKLKNFIGEAMKGTFHEVSFGASIQKQIEKSSAKKRYQNGAIRKWGVFLRASDEFKRRGLEGFESEQLFPQWPHPLNAQMWMFPKIVVLYPQIIH